MRNHYYQPVVGGFEPIIPPIWGAEIIVVLPQGRKKLHRGHILTEGFVPIVPPDWGYTLVPVLPQGRKKLNRGFVLVEGLEPIPEVVVVPDWGFVLDPTLPHLRKRVVRQFVPADSINSDLFLTFTQEGPVRLVQDDHSRLFEVYMKAVSGTVHARLFDKTGGNAVPGSEVSTTSTTGVRLRTSALTLTNGSEYYAQFSFPGGGFEMFHALIRA